MVLVNGSVMGKELIAEDDSNRLQLIRWTSGNYQIRVKYPGKLEHKPIDLTAKQLQEIVISYLRDKEISEELIQLLKVREVEGRLEK